MSDPLYEEAKHAVAEVQTLRARLAECERERDVAVTEAEIRRLALLVAIGERDAAIRRAATAEGKLRETTYAALAARGQGEADTVARIVAWLTSEKDKHVGVRGHHAAGMRSSLRLAAANIESGAWRGKEQA